MALDFPSSPAIGQQHPFTPVPGQPVYIWDGEKWVPAPLTGAVRYDAVQSLSGSQQTQARDNIGASSGTTGAVRYDTAQTLTTPQLVQARTNIYAAPLDALAYNGMQINGGMEVSQERGSTATTTSGAYVCDGWGFYKIGTMVVSAGQSLAGPIAPGIAGVLYLVVATAQASLAAGDYTFIMQQIEGWRCARLAWGTANAQPLTISFWSSHHRTGVYTGALQNTAGTRSYAFTYTQVAADVAQYNIITIPGCTDGTWVIDNTTGLKLIFAMACGSTNTAPSANAWVAGAYVAAPGQINAVAATSDVFRITGVTVLPGTQAPTAAQSPNIMRPYDQELVTCKRYWQKSYFASQAPGTASAAGGHICYADGMTVATHTVLDTVYFSSTMRAAPTVTLYSSITGASGKIRDAAGVADVAGAITAALDTCFVWTVTTGIAAAQTNLQFHWTSDARL